MIARVRALILIPLIIMYRRCVIRLRRSGELEFAGHWHICGGVLYIVTKYGVVN